MLELYRAALHIRRAEPSLGAGPLEWLASTEGVISFARGYEFVCVANISDKPIVLPPHDAILLTSIPLVESQLPVDAAAWLRVVHPR
jgi:alpha-glucosidase